RRELRGGPGVRHLGAGARRRVAAASGSSPAAGRAHRPAPRARVLEPHPRRHPRGSGRRRAALARAERRRALHSRRAGRRRAGLRRRAPAATVLAVFCVVNLLVAIVALPYIPGNARYVLFLIGPAAVLMADRAPGRQGGLILLVLVAGNTLASLAQAWPTAR